jgi:hypothetical protein
MRFLALGCVVILGSGPASAVAGPQDSQEKMEAPLVTDRPSESTSAVLLPRLTFQVEAGYIFKRRDQDGKRTDTQELPDTMFRFGVTSRLETRVQVTGWSFSDTLSIGGHQIEDGFNDVSVGATIFLAGARGWRPALAVLCEVSLPVGDPGFTDSYTRPKFLALMNYTLARRIGLTLNAGPSILRLKDENVGVRTGTDLLYVATIDASANDRIGLFGEVYGALALDEGREDRHSCQAGVTFLLTRLFQLDARAGAGLAGPVPNWLVGAGLSFRIPH